MKKKISVLLVMLMLLMSIPVSAEASGVQTSAEGAEKLVIMHTNDMHGFFLEGKYDGMGAAKMARYINGVRLFNKNVLLLDAGDALQGYSIATLSKGEYAVEILNELGYDAMTAGNHEFDYGSERLLELAGMADFPILSANIKNADGSSFLPEYVIKEVGDLKVGIFGLTTPETLFKSHPDNTKGLTFEDPVARAQEMADMLAPQVDVVIALVHLGYDEGAPTSVEVANAVTGIDLIIDGHSHTTLEEGVVVNGTTIVSAGEKTKNVGRVDIQVAGNDVVSVTPKMFTKDVSVMVADDPAIAKVVADIQTLNEQITEQVVANSPIELNGVKGDVRTGETNMGNMITEALLDISGADVALTNGGGIRTSIDVGEVTRGEVLSVLPFGNTVRVIELQGSDILAAIENGIDSYPETKGAFPHIAGMTVQFDSSQPAGSRVVEIKVGGELLDLEKTYSMATNDFLVAGGDGYTMFTGKKVIGEYGAMDEVLTDYMNNVGFDKAPVTGRIMDIANQVSMLIQMLIAA